MKNALMNAGLAWPEDERAYWLGRILETSSNEIYLFRDDNLRFIEVNEGARRNLGYSQDELRQLTPLDIKPSISAAAFDKLIAPLRQGDEDVVLFETEHRRKDGSVYPVEVHLQICKTESLSVFVAILTDTTKRSAAEAKYKYLFDSSPDAILIMDDRNFTECNRAALKMFGVDSRESLSSLWTGIILEDITAPPAWASRMVRLSKIVGLAEFNGEILLRRANGEYFPAWLILSPLMENGRESSQLILRDVSAQKRIENALRESEERFSLAIAGANDGLWDWNLKTNEVIFSPRWKSMLGYEDHELANHLSSWSDNVHADDIGSAMREVEDYLSGKISEYSIEFRMRHKLGHYVDLLSRGIIVRDGGGVPSRFVGTHVDMSERKRSEQLLRLRCGELAKANETIAMTQAQLFQSEKMASIGELAAGIAHEINNPVGFVSSNLSTLKEYSENLLGLIELYARMEVCPDDGAHLKDIMAFRAQIDLDYIKGDVHKLITESEEGVGRVARIVKDLKSFSHAGQGDYQLSDLHEGLESTLNIAHNEIKYRAELVRKYGDLPSINCNPSQINQVFMNLIINAAQAIESRGTITIRSGRRGDEWGWVEISDTGSGIRDNLKTRIFEPFFTTKEVGKGTGLGLAISYRIIENHGGRIEVESVLGEGSTFRVLLPLKMG